MEESIEPIIQLKSGNLVTVINEADKRISYKHVIYPDGRIELIPFHKEGGQET